MSSPTSPDVSAEAEAEAAAGGTGPRGAPPRSRRKGRRRGLLPLQLALFALFVCGVPVGRRLGLWGDRADGDWAWTRRQAVAHRGATVVMDSQQQGQAQQQEGEGDAGMSLVTVERLPWNVVAKSGGVGGQAVAAGLSRRRLGKNREPSSCTQHCDPNGGFLSIIGNLVGQCDCDVEKKTTGSGNNREVSFVCPDDGDGITCCASFDNAGGVLVYFIVVLYSFLGLAIICDDYFCESLDKISEALKLSDDVAGATFMAAGSSAPEIFTAVVTVLITGGSEGLGAIIGSALVNALLIGAATAFAACSGDSKLPIWWYPLTRDCLAYVFSIVVMLLVMLDYKVTWYEAFLMILCYGAYIYLMYRNEDIVAYVKTNIEHDEAAAEQEQRPNSIEQNENVMRAIAAVSHAYDLSGPGPDLQVRHASLTGAGARPEPSQAAIVRPAGYDARTSGANALFRPAFRYTPNLDLARKREEQRRSMSNIMGSALQVNRAANIFLSKIGRSTHSIEVEEDEVEESLGDKIMAFMSIPYEKLFEWTVPNCTESRWANWYMLTFTMSILYIGLLSFVMVDFAARAGCVLGIPSLVMGLLIIAAGTSVPDALASITVAKNGFGGMALSNAIGSNTVNILLGLGFPWLLSTIIVGKAFPLNRDEPVVTSVLILLIYIVFFFGIIWYSGFALTRNVGKIFLAGYMVFVIWTLLTGLDPPAIDIGTF